MKDEEIFAALRDHVRGEQAHDATLVEVARGARAADGVGEGASGEEAANLLALADASRPLGEDFEAKVTARVRAGRAPVAAVAPVRRLDVARLGRVVAPLALAAALLVWVGTRSSPGEGGASLPDYVVAARGDLEMRGDDPAPAGRLRVTGEASTFEILLRPSVATSEPVRAWPFRVADGAEPAPLAADVDVSPQGAVRVRGRGVALAGAREVRVVVAPVGTTPEVATERARAGRGDARARVLVVTVER